MQGAGLTGQELADALAELGVDVTGWCQVSIKPDTLGAEKERFWRQGWQLGDWLLAPGAGIKKVAPNFGDAIDRGAFVHHLVSAQSVYVDSLEELAGHLLDPTVLAGTT